MKRGAVIALLAIWSGGAATAAEIPLSERKSGYEFMGGEARAMQDDDTANPAMLWVLDGEALWSRKQGEAGKSCADCHADAQASMKGVTARYPAFDAARARPVDLEQRINICRTEQQKATPLPFESKELLALAAYIAMQSRGMPIEARDDEHLAPFLRAGADMFKLGRGSSISPARSATTTTGDESSRARRFRRPTQLAIRSTAWNGRRSDHCSGACATASAACGRRPMPTGRRNMSSSSLKMGIALP